jgi:hypothetical protein
MGGGSREAARVERCDGRCAADVYTLLFLGLIETGTRIEIFKRVEQIVWAGERNPCR